MQVYIDNIPLQYPSETLLKPHFTLRRKNESGEKAFSYTGDLVFEGADAKYIRAQLIDDPNAITNKVVLKFYDECCDRTYMFYIQAASVKWCEKDCTITAAATEFTKTEEQYTCLKNTLIWDDHIGFKSKQHPRFAYCNELRPNWLHDCMIIFFLATATSLLVLGPIIIGLVFAFNTINAVINLLNTLLPSSSQINNVTLGGNTSLDFNDLQNYFNLLVSFIVGCGRKHPSPLVRDYIDNVCKKCGLSFVSSILNNPLSSYYNVCYVNAPINKGTLETDNTTYWIEENAPLLNGLQLLKQMNGIFNGAFDINNSVLTFEREDFFVPKTPWLDLTTFDPDNTEVCWNWTNKPRYSYGTFYYQKDAINFLGGEAIGRWGDIVEWNNPYSPLQKDEFKPFIEFAACRFRDDGIDRDVLSAYKNFPTIGPIIKKYDNVMLFNAHVCFMPMLLIWDTNTPASNAKVDPTAAYFGGFADGPNGQNVGVNQFYNYPMWFREGYPNNLYTNFWYIKNPRVAGWAAKDYKAKILFTCNELKNLNLDGMVTTSYGDAAIDQIDIDYATQTMELTGSL